MSAQNTLSDLIRGQNPYLFDGTGILDIFQLTGALDAATVDGNALSVLLLGVNSGPSGDSGSLVMTNGYADGLIVNGTVLSTTLAGTGSSPSGSSGSLLMTNGEGDGIYNTFIGATIGIWGAALFNGSGGYVALANAANFSGVDGTPLHGTDGSIVGLAAFQSNGSLGLALAADLAPYLAAGKLVTNSTPTTGQTVNAAGVSQDELIYIQPAGTLLALTIQLEPGGGAVADIGDIKEIFISQIITGLTVSATGGTVRGTALTTSSAVNGSYEYIKVTSTDWLRIR